MELLAGGRGAEFLAFALARDTLDRIACFVRRKAPLVSKLRLLARERSYSAMATSVLHRADVAIEATTIARPAALDCAYLDRIDWQDRVHFFRVASQAMRWILVDYARRRGAVKRGGLPHRVPLLDEILTIEQQAETVLAVDEALTRLNQFNARLADVVQLRFFGGLGETETAETLGISIRTVRRDWIKARGWLYRELSASESI